MMISSKLIFLGILLTFISNALGHSYLTNPISRSDQTQTESGCRGPACLGPCDIPLAQTTRAPITIQRGALINPHWPRNNHAGGFIRFSWAPTSDSDNAASFNDGVQEIVCHEIGGCQPSDPSDPNGGDNGPADGSSQPCQTNITVPLYLSNGAWTLQWAWFGGAFELGDYYSCVDYTISGGPTGPKLSAVYIGGDYSNPGQDICKFFNTDRLGQCVDEPCSNPIYPLAQQESGPAYGFGNSESETTGTTGTTAAGTTAAQPPVTTAAHAPATTGNQAPVTTAAHSPATTAAHSPVTTASNSPVTTASSVHTTGKVPVATTASAPVVPPTPVTTASAPSSGSNCAGLTTLSTSTVTISYITSWSNEFDLIFNLQVDETVLSNWMVEVIWPENAVNTQIVDIYNGGAIQCQGTLSAMIKPVASWANNLPQGYVLPIEVIATNTNMDNTFIVENTQFKVYKM